MKKWSCGVGLVAAAIAAGAACGESSPAPSANKSDGGDGGASTALDCAVVKEEEKITYTGAAAPAYTCNENKSTLYPSGPNACRNTSDCAIINTGMVRELVRSCGTGCRSYGPPEFSCERMARCNSDCVRMGTATTIMQPGLSDACGACYTNIALCSLAFCVEQCIGNADAIECVTCQFAAGCRVPFEKCSGVDRQQ